MCNRFGFDIHENNQQLQIAYNIGCIKNIIKFLEKRGGKRKGMFKKGIAEWNLIRPTLGTNLCNDRSQGTSAALSHCLSYSRLSSGQGFVCRFSCRCYEKLSTCFRAEKNRRNDKSKAKISERTIPIKWSSLRVRWNALLLRLPTTYYRYRNIDIHIVLLSIFLPVTMKVPLKFVRKIVPDTSWLFFRCRHEAI